jgi:hypothetical protein
MATRAVITSIQGMIHQDIGKQVFEMLPSREIEPFFAGLGLTSEGVTPFADVSKGYLINLTLSSGLSGQLKWVDPTPSSESKYASNRYHTNATALPANRYPSATNLPMKAIINVQVPMAKGMGNIAWPLEFKRAEQMTAAIAKYTELNMKASAKMLALNQANSFFAPASGVIATISAVSSTGASDGVITATITNGRIFQFTDGMIVDIYRLDSGTQGTDAVWSQRNVTGAVATRCVVDGVNYLGTTYNLRMVCDTTTDAAIAAGDLIVLADTYVNDTNDYARKGPMGIEDMLKAAAASTYVMSPANSSSYGFDLSKYPNFGSLVAAISGVLDEQTLNKYLGTFFDATGLTIDTIVTTRGVINKYSEYPLLDSARQVWDRSGAGLKFTGGRSTVSQTYEGRDWELMQSRFVAPGTLYGVKRKGNFKIAVPPSVPGTTSQGTEYGAPIEFVGQALGYADDFIPVLANSEHTDMVQSPFSMFYQVICETPQGIKLTAITED